MTKSSIIHYLFYAVIGLAFFSACDEDDAEDQLDDKNFCDIPISALDSLIIEPYHLFFNTSFGFDSVRNGLIEIVDLNNNRIDTLSNLVVRQIKVKGSGKCFETNEFSLQTASNGIALKYSNVPEWAPNPLNQAIIELDFNGIRYYLEDPSVNN